MAVYVEPGRRKGISWTIAVIALVVGLFIGGAIGRGTATSIDDEIAAGRSGGQDFVTALNVLPLEYQQAASGSSETALINDTVNRTVLRLPATLDGAPWLSPAARKEATAAARSVKVAAESKVTSKQFDQTVARATTTLQIVFGLPATG